MNSSVIDFKSGAFTARAAVFAESTAFARGLGAINLAQGIPAAHMNDALNSALLEAVGIGWQYVDPRGLPRLREAISHEIYDDRFSPSDVLVTSGCTESVTIALQQLGAHSGSKVAFLEPFYPYYLGMAEMAHLQPVPIRMRLDGARYTPDWEAIERAIAVGVRILILNTPHNPTGWVLSPSEAENLERLIARYGVFVIVDEAYKSFVYDAVDDRAVQRLYAVPEHCLFAGSFSKLFFATGLRVGWLAGGARCVERAHSLHMHLTYCQPGPIQQAIASLLEAREPTEVAHWLEEFRQKRDILAAAVEKAGLSCCLPAGGHFLIARYSLPASLPTPELFSRQFARQYGVMPLPMTPFYLDARGIAEVRFSFSAKRSDIEAAAKLLAHSSSDDRTC